MECVYTELHVVFFLTCASTELRENMDYPSHENLHPPFMEVDEAMFADEDKGIESIEEDGLAVAWRDNEPKGGYACVGLPRCY